MNDISPLLKIFIVFTLMLAMGRLRVPLFLSLILGGLAINWWGVHSAREVFKNFMQAMAQINLWLLVAVTALAVEFGRELADKKNAGTMASLAQRLGGKSGRLWSMMLMPSLVGLMPMPAGALFSAPLVQQNAHEDHWKPEWKAAVNYWFRHVWEYWWPVYPVVIIGIAVLKMDTWRFIATMIAFTPATFLFGYYWLLRPYRRELVSSETKKSASLAPFFRLMLPLLVVIALVLALPPLFSTVLPACDQQTTKLLAMLLGIIGGLLIIWRRTEKKKLNRATDGNSSVILRGAKDLRHADTTTEIPRCARNDNPIFKTPRLTSLSFLKPHNLSILLTVGCIMLFQYLLESSGLLPAAAREMVNSGFSLIPIVAILPFLAGFVTGVASTIAGIAFPLIAGLLACDANGLTPMATLALAFGFGYMGMMTSPIHLCLIMTRDYFSAKLLPIYRQIALCVISQLIFTILAFMLLRALKM